MHRRDEAFTSEIFFQGKSILKIIYCSNRPYWYHLPGVQQSHEAVHGALEQLVLANRVIDLSLQKSTGVSSEI